MSDVHSSDEWLRRLRALPFVVGGGLLVAGHASGMYWLVLGVLASFAAGIQNAWILLVEILR